MFSRRIAQEQHAFRLTGALGRLALGGEPYCAPALAPLAPAALLGSRAAAQPQPPVLPPVPPLLKGPSGPRRAGEGVEEEEQAVVSVEKLANGGLQARSHCKAHIRIRTL